MKQNPLYEDSGFAYFDTHYYGGIKKYQWVTIPLGIHGVIVRKDGTKEVVSIGEKEEDPVFAVTDLLVHLSSKQMEKKASAVVEGENLDILIGSRPLAGEEKEAVAAQIMKLLADTYHIEREDLMSAELEVVPAGKARDCGLDRSMVMAYGQDDRICAYTSLAAMLDVETVSRTSCCILVDKEEIGSVGATGMHSRFFENTAADVLEKLAISQDKERNGNKGQKRATDRRLRHVLQNSQMLSADVSAAYDPLYETYFEKKKCRVSFGGRCVLQIQRERRKGRRKRRQCRIYGKTAPDHGRSRCGVSDSGTGGGRQRRRRNDRIHSCGIWDGCDRLRTGGFGHACTVGSAQQSRFI